MRLTEENAARAGVGDRVELHTADMRELSFPEATSGREPG